MTFMATQEVFFKHSGSFNEQLEILPEVFFLSTACWLLDLLFSSAHQIAYLYPDILVKIVLKYGHFTAAIL